MLPTTFYYSCAFTSIAHLTRRCWHCIHSPLISQHRSRFYFFLLCISSIFLLFSSPDGSRKNIHSFFTIMTFYNFTLNPIDMKIFSFSHILNLLHNSIYYFAENDDDNDFLMCVKLEEKCTMKWEPINSQKTIRFFVVFSPLTSLHRRSSSFSMKNNFLFKQQLRNFSSLYEK